jgi:preprotein translocase subunit YajC
MDNNYLYIVGFLGILLVTFVVYYFLTRRKEKETMNGQQIEQHIKEDHGVTCDGDKCFIKHTSSNNYDKCD